MRDVAADLVSILVAAGLPLAEGDSLFSGPTREEDTTARGAAVFVLQTGGVSSPYVSGGTRTRREVSCHVNVRGARGAFAAGQTLALTALDAIHMTTPPPYTRVVVNEGAPTYQGESAGGSPWWSFTVEAEFDDDATAGVPVLLPATGDVSVGGNVDAASFSIGGVPFTGGGGGVDLTTAQTVGGLKTFTDGVRASVFGALASATATLLGYVANGASAVAAVIDSANALTTAGAKLLSVRNAGVERAFIDKDGRAAALVFTGVSSSTPAIDRGSQADGASAVGVVLDTGNAFAADGSKIASFRNGYTEMASVLRNGSVNAPIYSGVGDTPVLIRGTPPNNGSAIAVTLDSARTLGTAGAKLLSVTNGNVEKAFIDKDGEYECLTAAKGVILNSPNGTRYRITVENDGTLTTTAV